MTVLVCINIFLIF